MPKKSAEKWIQKAIKHPGALKEHYGVGDDEEIPIDKARSDLKKLQDKAKGDATLSADEKKLHDELNLFVNKLYPMSQKKKASQDLLPGMICLAHQHAGLRPVLLPLIQREILARQAFLKSKKSPLEEMEFKHPDTGNKVKFKSLPEDMQAKIREKYKGRGEGSGGGDDKAKSKLLSKGITKFKPTPENVALAGKEMAKSVEKDPADLAREHSGKDLRKIEDTLKTMSKMKGGPDVGKAMKSVMHAQNMQARGIGKKAMLAVRARMIRMAHQDPKLRPHLLPLVLEATA